MKDLGKVRVIIVLRRLWVESKPSSWTRPFFPTLLC